MVDSRTDASFTRSVEYTVAVTFRVAGTSRPGRAERHALAIASRLADIAARRRDVVEVTAAGGFSSQGKVGDWRPLTFAAVNARHPVDIPRRSGWPRYLDPSQARLLEELVVEREQARERRDADRSRRGEVGCANTHPSLLHPVTRDCGCVYCRPADHIDHTRSDGPPRCPCGDTVTDPGGRCGDHVGVTVRVLPGDGPELMQAGLVDATVRLQDLPRHLPAVDESADVWQVQR